MRTHLVHIVISILVCLTVKGVCGQCVADQRDLLTQLKNTLTENADKLVQWGHNNSDCCSWDGVACDASGFVTGLNLSGKSISGELDTSTLFNLQHLKTLDLSYNKFNTTVPVRIGNLTNLTHLNLSNAGFGGQIPIQVSELTRLVSLEISTLGLWQFSSLKLENPNLSMLIENLSELEELYLDGVNISAPGSEWGRALSSSLPRLRVLSLTNCYLSGPIDTSLQKLASLSVIRLDNNNLSSTIPPQFSSLSNLTSLRLNSCGLFGTFPREIFLVATLEVIDIASNLLLHGSLPEFHNSSSLQKLVLFSTNFSGSLPKSIGNLRNLSTLYLYRCQFNGTLPTTMTKLRQLVLVDVSFNKFEGPVPSFEMSSNLTEVVLSHNSFTGPITLARWDVLKKLVVIDLRNNHLKGSIPSSVFELPSLELLQLSNNQFEGQLPEFQNASSSPLETIELSSNNLEGEIPVSVFGLRKLNILSLSSNNLKGTLQLDQIQGFRNLTVLDLSYNNLSVTEGDNFSVLSFFSKLSTLNLASCRLNKLPNLENHPKLVKLDLSMNQIHGEVPNWIWKLGNGGLSHLNLSGNSLVGLQEPYNFPRSLNLLDLHMNRIHGNIRSLPIGATYIDLSNNNFYSFIPSNIGKNLSNTVFLSLSSNNLTGFVPESVCDATAIQVLDLSNNSLGGGIPACMPTISQSLRVLSLQRNHFTSQIPDSFPLSCALKTLNLNENLLEGQIPKSLVNCSELEVLNLGNNKLTGKFPCMLRNISTLRVLVLRSNNFNGVITRCNSNGTWKKLQIVDLAHNKFSGEIPKKGLARWEAMHEDDSVSGSNHVQFEILKFSDVYYQDAVTITSKGLELEFVKILTVFTSIDLSCNSFSGKIPEQMGLLSALYVLNLSHNALTGKIPPVIGNLTQLESLDLSSNNLDGSIPASLGYLTFLSFLNLSFNHLAGQIPLGSQMQTFPAESYSGNAGLCGFPLPIKCTDINLQKNKPDEEASFWSNVDVDWQSIYTAIGFGVGAGAVVALLMLYHDGTRWLENNVDKILYVVLPIFGFTYKPREEWDDDDFPIEDDDHGEIEMEDIRSQGRFCVFCTKLDVTRKKAVHDFRCTCHSSPSKSSSSSSSFYSSPSSITIIGYLLL